MGHIPGGAAEADGDAHAVGQPRFNHIGGAKMPLATLFFTVDICDVTSNSKFNGLDNGLS